MSQLSLACPFHCRIPQDFWGCLVRVEGLGFTGTPEDFRGVVRVFYGFWGVCLGPRSLEFAAESPHCRPTGHDKRGLSLSDP